jgi:hypothetical protein
MNRARSPVKSYDGTPDSSHAIEKDCADWNAQ